MSTWQRVCGRSVSDEEPTSDPAFENEPPDDPSLEQPRLTDQATVEAEDRDDATLTSPFAFMLPEILENILSCIPPRDRVHVICVNQSWNRASVEASAECWRGLQLGRNVNCFSATPSFPDGDDIFPLCRVEDVKLDPAVPFVMPGPVQSTITELPLPWLRVVLRHGLQLKSLNLSGKVHFWTDAEDVGAQNLGFLRREN